MIGLGGKCYALIELEDHVEQATAPAEERRIPSTKGEARRAALRAARNGSKR